MQINTSRIGKRTGIADFVYDYDVEVEVDDKTCIEIQGLAYVDRGVPDWDEDFVLEYVTVKSCQRLSLVNGVWESTVVVSEYIKDNADALEAMALIALKDDKHLQEYCEEYYSEEFDSY